MLQRPFFTQHSDKFPTPRDLKPLIYTPYFTEPSRFPLLCGKLQANYDLKVLNKDATCDIFSD